LDFRNFIAAALGAKTDTAQVAKSKHEMGQVINAAANQEQVENQLLANSVPARAFFWRLNDVRSRHLIKTAQFLSAWRRRGLEDVRVGTGVFESAAWAVGRKPGTDTFLENVPEAAAESRAGKIAQP
jgi:hypothetical protein